MRPRRAYEALKAARAEVISKRKDLSSSTFTVIPCIRLEKTSYRDCNCPDLGDKCSIFKTPCRLVSSIGTSTGYISDVTSTDFQKKYSMTTISRLAYQAHTRFQHKNLWYERNGVIYVISSDPITEYISVRGIFDDPVSASSCGCSQTGDGACISPLDQEFSIDSQFLPIVIKRAKEILYGIQPREDVSANSRDTPPQEAK